jgi:hypothetical protein
MRSAPWHVGEMFDSIDDKYYYWNLLFNDVLRRMRVRSKDIPYMTAECLQEIQQMRICN